MDLLDLDPDNDERERVAIVGSRKLPREDGRRVIFNGVASTPVDAVIVSGAARGPVRSRTTVSADREAARAARFYRRELEELPADWDGQGLGAGFIRNRRLVEKLTGPRDRLVAVWDGSSPGTKHVAGLARDAGRLSRLITLTLPPQKPKDAPAGPPKAPEPRPSGCVPVELPGGGRAIVCFGRGRR
jgi:hypothetical protein